MTTGRTGCLGGVSPGPDLGRGTGASRPFRAQACQPLFRAAPPNLGSTARWEAQFARSWGRKGRPCSLSANRTFHGLILAGVGPGLFKGAVFSGELWEIPRAPGRTEAPAPFTCYGSFFLFIFLIEEKLINIQLTMLKCRFSGVWCIHSVVQPAPLQLQNFIITPDEHPAPSKE